MSTWLIRYNRADAITLTGLVLCAIGLALIQADALQWALAVLFLAMLADALDGMLARKWGISRDFGRYLDGFVDTFLYLVAPAFWLWQWGFQGWYAGLMIMLVWISGITRLAVFNIAGNDAQDGKLIYRGMPVFWLLLIVGLSNLLALFIHSTLALIVISIAWPLSALLMIWNRPFFKFQQLSHILAIVVSGVLLFSLAATNELDSRPLTAQADLKELGTTLLHALWLTLPIVVGGVLHMLAVSKAWLNPLAKPIHAPLFGPNKTWRGVVLMPLLTLPGVALLYLLAPSALLQHFDAVSGWVLGLALGLGYIAMELPNSYIKRRLGIPAGETPARYRLTFIMIDQWDSALGFGAVYWLVSDVSWVTILSMVVLFPLVALTVKRILFILRWKEKSV